MQNMYSILCLCYLCTACAVQETQQHVFTTDIDHFWTAYDQIGQTTDSSEQYRILQEQFLLPGTPGLAAIRQVRNYTPEQYLAAINNYPLFWKSIRPNMQRVDELGIALEEGITQLKKMYPALSPAGIYFTVGAFRTNGTTLDSLVLIGSELALADAHTHTGEFGEQMDHLPRYFQQNPIDNIVFLNIHEYIHTQQKPAPEGHLLTQCLREGAAEFITEKVMQQASTTPAIAFGRQHDPRIKEKFAKEMFSHYYQNWLWSNMENEFHTRDLGYYVGYALAQKYYQQQTDSQQAIEDLIELDYGSNAAVEQFVDAIGYFAEPVQTLKENYRFSRPTVRHIQPFSNGDQNVDPSITDLIITFSAPMDPRFRNLRLGPLGEEHVLPVTELVGFSADSTSIHYKIALESGRTYQLLIHDQFRSVDGVLLQPYLIDIHTH